MIEARELFGALKSAYSRAGFGLAFALIAVVVVGVGALIARDLRRANQEARQMYAGAVHGLDLIGELQYQIQEARRSMLYALTTSDSNLQVEYADQSRAADAQAGEILRDHMKLVVSAQEIGAAKRFERDWLAYLAIRDEVIASILEGSIKDAGDHALREGVPAFDLARDDLQEIKRLYKEQAEQLAEVETSFNHSLLKVIVVLCLTQLFAVVAVKMIQKGKMLRAVQQSEARKAAIMESALDCIITMDHQGRITEFNPAAEKTFGYTRDQVINKELADTLIPPPFRESHRQRLAKYLATGQGPMLGERIELTAIRAGGAEFPVEMAITPVRLNQLPMFTAYLRDVTERNKAQEDLQKAMEIAESANRSKSEFLANMSHELRTPLNAIIGYSEMLEEEAEDSSREDFIPDLRKIQSAGKHLLTLINSILDLSKIEAGKMQLYLEAFDLSEMIQDVVTTTAPLVKQNANELVVRCSDSLGFMHSDLTKVRQVLFNLLSNACKFTKSGTISLAVSRETRDENDYITFRVSDTGIGMADKQVQRLFREFSQADASITREYGGTGLGLAISKRFCLMMGGDIIVESAQGVGSSFTACLPAEVTDQKNEAATSAEKPNISTSYSAAPPESLNTILVIDDDPAVRDLMVRFLSKAGFHVVSASSGDEGLRLAERLQPTVITLDVMMPGMDGWAVLTALKADPELAGIPVIVFTILEKDGLGYALGASDYLTKPIDRDQLLATVNKYKTRAPAGRVPVVDGTQPPAR